jgi:nuclear transport factor 2 (NTF2) superfamily protein
MTTRPPLPPFTEQTARQKVQAAETRGTRAIRARSLSPTPRTPPGATAARSSPDTARSWDFLTQKWERELDYTLRKELWAFDSNGLMSHREASINDVPIQEKNRPHRRHPARPAAPLLARHGPGARPHRLLA